MKKNLHLFALALGTWMMVSCANPKKILDAGNYDQAIQLATQRLRGKKTYKLKHVLVIEDAFQKAQESDLRKIASLKAENRLENWTTIHKIYTNIAKRQSVIEPFLPIYADNGYQPDFAFVKVEPLLIESRERAAAFHYELALDLLEEAKQGNRLSAREALVELEKVDALFYHYKAVGRLKDSAVLLGTEQWLIALVNQSGMVLPSGFERQLLGIGTTEFDSYWRAFHTRVQKGQFYDYEVKLVIDEIRISPEIYRERQFDESKEIEDGYTYVLDAHGNVMKDTLGNDIKVPKTKWISATILEVYQQKITTVKGHVIIRDPHRDNILYSQPVQVENNFDHYASKLVSGDKRALSKEGKRHLGSSPMRFPSDEEMLLDGVGALKNDLRRVLQRQV